MPSAGDLVTDYLAAQWEVIESLAKDVRADEPDTVHRTRVATRRARSALRVFAPVFRRTPRKALLADLSWYADQLGPARDAEVLLARITSVRSEIPEEVWSDSATGWVEQLADARTQANADLLRAMASGGYRSLSERFAAFVAEPPLRSAGRQPAKRVLPELVTHATQRVEKRAAHAAADPDDVAHWHAVRKAAKAVRYASEAMIPLGDWAVAQAQAWKEVTSALGDVQDTAVAVEELDRLVSAARAADEPADAYLALRARELDERTEALADGRSALASALALEPAR